VAVQLAGHFADHPRPVQSGPETRSDNLEAGAASRLPLGTVPELRALLNRALAAMPEGQARQLVLDAVRMLDDQAVELVRAEQA
jgi:hypothetical protein